MLIELCILFSVIYFFQLKSRQEDKKYGLHGPYTMPFLGNILDLAPYVTSKTTFVKFLEYCKKYGDTYRIRIGSEIKIITRDVNLIKKISSNPKFGKSIEYRFLKEWTGLGVLLSEGKDWHDMRRIFTSAFHLKNLEKYSPIFEENANELVAEFAKKGDTVFDVVPSCHAFALNVALGACMGLHLGTSDERFIKLLTATDLMDTIIIKRSVNAFLGVNWIFHLTSLYKQQIQAIEYINSFVKEIIRQGNAEDYTFLGILQAANIDSKSLTEEQILTEIKTFIVAGREEVAVTLGFVLYSLAKHPNIQEKLYQELMKHKSEGKNIKNVQYLDNVVKETLRLYPSNPIIGKQCSENVQVDDITIPANTSIFTFIYGCHHNEKYFSSPEIFDPERFNEDFGAKNAYIHQPFSAGLRNCVGSKYALLQLKAAIISILTQFEVHLGDKNFQVNLSDAVTLRSSNGIMLKFYERAHIK